MLSTRYRCEETGADLWCRTLTGTASVNGVRDAEEKNAFVESQSAEGSLTNQEEDVTATLRSREIEQQILGVVPGNSKLCIRQINYIQDAPVGSFLPTRLSLFWELCWMLVGSIIFWCGGGTIDGSFD